MRQSSFSAVMGMAALSLLPLYIPAHAQSTNASPDKAAVLIFDASGSMWGQLDGGVTKIEVARDVMGQFFSTRDAAIPLGVVAYGHNRRGDCADIEVIAQTGVQDAAALSQRLNRLNPRGMTPISESLRLAASQIPPTAEEADIILVTDGLETCEADPCAVAAQLANEGIKIRAHVVGFGLTEQEADALACVPDQTGGQLLRPQSGAELTDALNQIAAAEPMPEPEPEPVQEAFFDIGPKAEAGHTYRISYRGTARNSDFAGFTPRGEGRPRASASFGPIGGSSTAPANPFSKQAPAEPGEYDLILDVQGQGIIARQPIEVVAPSNGFDPIGTVEPGSRMDVAFRGPEQGGEQLVLARPDQPVSDFRSYGWDFAMARNGRFRVRAPDEPGEYELRYLNGAANEIMFSRRFGVGIPFEDADLTTSEELAARAAAATQAEPGQDDLPMVRATFRIPASFPETPLWWSAVPLDPDMSPEAWAPQAEMWVAEGEFEPGRYEVSTMGPGEVEFRGVVEIVPGKANDFVIPLVGGGEEQQNPPEQRGDAVPSTPEPGIDVAVLCDGDTNCDYFDPDTGLRMVVPAGWAMGEASFVSATAGAIPQENPRISFFRIGGGDEERFEFNPHQWLASNGPCESTLIGAVCHFADAPDSTKLAMMTAGLYARIDTDGMSTGGNAFEHKAGVAIDPRGPYAAGQKTVFIVRRDEALESDEIAIFPATGPLSETTILSRNRDLGGGFYGSVTMPSEPGEYRIAVLREGDRIVQGVSEVRVEPDPEMRFTDWNAQPFPGRPLSVNLHGRMAYDDAIAILAPDGRELARASVFDAMTGRLRTPEGLSGAHRLVHVARGPAGERQMASVALDIGARGNTVDAGGAGGTPIISVAPRVLVGSRVDVSVRGAIPEKPILGFIRTNAAENQILETSQRFLPDMPSITVNAPRQTGQWMMRLADQNLWRFAEVPVEVVDYLDEAEPEAVSGVDIKPRDGTWTVAIGNTALQGCPDMIADQIRGAAMEGRSSSRNITFADPFHPAPLMEDSALRVDWEKTGPGGWQARLVQQSMGEMGSVEARYELTIVSETELREVSHFSLQLPAELMAIMGGGDGKCTSRTNATWNWQG